MIDIHIYKEKNEIAKPMTFFFFADAFHGLSEVDYFTLGTNNLTTITTDTFRFPNKLISLFLHYNNISTIEPGAFVLPADTSKWLVLLSFIDGQLFITQSRIIGAVRGAHSQLWETTLPVFSSYAPRKYDKKFDTPAIVWNTGRN